MHTNVNIVFLQGIGTTGALIGDEPGLLASRSGQMPEDSGSRICDVSLEEKGESGLADGVRQGFETQNMFECDMRQVRCMCLSYLFD